MEFTLSPIQRSDEPDPVLRVTFDVLADGDIMAGLIRRLNTALDTDRFPVVIAQSTEGDPYVVTWAPHVNLDIAGIARCLYETAGSAFDEPVVVTYTDDDGASWQIDPHGAEPWQTYDPATGTTFHSREEWAGWAHGSHGSPT